MSLDKFQAQLAAAGKGALPDGEYLCVVTEVKRLRNGNSNVFCETEGGRRVRCYVKKGDYQPGQAVSVKVWRTPDGKVSTSISANPGAVFATRDARLTVQGELQQSSVGDATDLLPPPSEAPKPHPVAGEVPDTPATPNVDNLGEYAYGKLMQGRQVVQIGLTDIAEACWLIREHDLWRDINGGFDTLNEFLADPEVSMDRRSFFRAASIWAGYVVEGGYDPDVLLRAPESKWEAALPAAVDGSVAREELVADVETLGVVDLRRKYRGVPDEKCDTHFVGCARCRAYSDEQLQGLG